jgi:hypothetical protein
MKRTNSSPHLFFLVLVGYVYFGLSLAFSFCLFYDGFDHRSLLDFCVNQGQVTLVVIHPQHGHTSFPMDRALMDVELHN